MPLMDESMEEFYARQRDDSDEVEMTFEEMHGEIVARMLFPSRRNILPFPELPQDLAMIAHMVDYQRRIIKRLEGQLKEAGIEPRYS